MAYDSIEAAVACPHCGDTHFLRGAQTKFFEPSVDEQRWMRPGETHPLARMPDPEQSAWARIRDPIATDRFTLLIDLDELFECSCGCPCIALFYFTHVPGQIRLDHVEAHDARTDIGSLVDFADGVLPWTGDWASYRPALRAFEQKPAAGRAAALSGVLRERVAERFDRELADVAPWTVLVGPTQCETCGDTRERIHYTFLSRARVPAAPRPFFGPEWPGGAIMLGDRVPFDENRVGDAVTRLRDPGTTIKILGAPNWWGCRCGAGHARYVAEFERDGDAIVLVELTLRASDDVSDIDYIETA